MAKSSIGERASVATDPVGPAPDPKLLDVKTAVSEICQACEGTDGRPYQTPFFLIVGAGISVPSVPLARHIIDECQAVARRYDRAAPPAQSSTLDEYSHWFSRAYPGARQRQQYLRSLIEKKPLSLASLRLAHLLSARRLTNLVITTNFDDFIARALRLFGQEPAVCDHPRTVGRIDRDRDDVQIVHVHGSYLFYDCANLRAEVNGRARIDEETSFTMVGLLDGLLWSRSPLVIGYSGWEGDVIMSALNRRLRGGNPLAQSIYWFCYCRSDLQRLPDWLRESADVRFVLPPEAPRVEAANRPGRRGGRRTEVQPEPVLRAVEVFDELNTKFDIGKPALFANPIEYFAKSLETSLPEAEGLLGDPYAFKALIEKLRRASAAFERTTASHGLEATLDRLRELMRESRYSLAAKLLATILPAKLPKLDESSRKEVLSATRIVGAAVSADFGAQKANPDYAHVLAIDARLDESLQQAPSGLALLVGSRPGQFGMESYVTGKAVGAFTAQLVDTLRDRAADRDGDGRISMLEATIEAGRRLISGDGTQNPVAAGNAADIALFASRPIASREREAGTVRALLVGVGKYRGGFDLAGPTNDVDSIAKALGQRERRLFAHVETRILRDGQATRAQVERALDVLLAKAKPSDLVLFYFSGHATRNPINTGPAPGKRSRAKKNGAQGEAKPQVEPTPLISLAFHELDNTGTVGVMAQPDLIAKLKATRAQRMVVILDF